MEILLKVLTFVFGAVCMIAAAGIFARLIEKYCPALMRWILREVEK
jgi:hypothetical protein